MAFESVEFAAECLAAPDGWSDEEVKAYIRLEQGVMADSSLLPLRKTRPIIHTHHTPFQVWSAPAVEPHQPLNGARGPRDQRLSAMLAGSSGIERQRRRGSHCPNLQP